MKNTTFKFLCGVLGLSLFTSLEVQATKFSKNADNNSSTPAAKPQWLLRNYLNLSAKNPKKLLSVATDMFSTENLRISSIEASRADDWQKRLAMVSALSDLFDPALNRTRDIKVLRKKSHDLLTTALLTDPSLLVRDGTVESIRRIIRMQPSELQTWRSPLEKAFLQQKNMVHGEGLFIRETILTAMKEAMLVPSKNLKRIALKDKNVNVRNLVQSTSGTKTFDDIGGR